MRLRFKGVKNNSIRMNHEKVSNSRSKEGLFGSN